MIREQETRDYLSTEQNQLPFPSGSAQNMKQILAGCFTQTLCGIMGTELAPLREPLSRLSQHKKPRNKRLTICLTTTCIFYLTTPQREKEVSATAIEALEKGRKQGRSKECAPEPELSHPAFPSFQAQFRQPYCRGESIKREKKKKIGCGFLPGVADPDVHSLLHSLNKQLLNIRHSSRLCDYIGQQKIIQNPSPCRTYCLVGWRKS